MRMGGKVAAAVASRLALLCTAAGSAAAANADAPRKPDGSTPLMWATFEGDVEEAARLLEGRR